MTCKSRAVPLDRVDFLEQWYRDGTHHALVLAWPGSAQYNVAGRGNTQRFMFSCNQRQGAASAPTCPADSCSC